MTKFLSHEESVCVQFTLRRLGTGVSRGMKWRFLLRCWRANYSIFFCRSFVLEGMVEKAAQWSVNTAEDQLKMGCLILPPSPLWSFFHLPRKAVTLSIPCTNAKYHIVPQCIAHISFTSTSMHKTVSFCGCVLCCVSPKAWWYIGKRWRNGYGKTPSSLFGKSLYTRYIANKLCHHHHKRSKLQFGEKKLCGIVASMCHAAGPFKSMGTSLQKAHYACLVTPTPLE